MILALSRANIVRGLATVSLIDLSGRRGGHPHFTPRCLLLNRFLKGIDATFTATLLLRLFQDQLRLLELIQLWL